MGLPQQLVRYTGTGTQKFLLHQAKQVIFGRKETFLLPLYSLYSRYEAKRGELFFFGISTEHVVTEE
jgi:hypothetical protein